MTSNNFIFYGLKIISELVRDVLYFPVWWYSRGLLKLLVMLEKFLSDKQKSLALLVWLKNIHRPMYGQYDWAGILISFFVRLVQIIVRSLVMLIWFILVMALLLAWVALPILVIYEIIFQIAL